MPNPNNPCEREFIDECAYIDKLRENGQLLSQQQSFGRLLRQPGKTSMMKAMWEYENHCLEQINATKRHHRCYCGSGKLNKNCCK